MALVLGSMFWPAVFDLLQRNYLIEPGLAAYDHWLTSELGIDKKVPKPSSLGALWRSALIPGWGQWYKGNGEKALIQVLAVGTAAYAVSISDRGPNNDYNLKPLRITLGALYGYVLIDAVVSPAWAAPYGQAQFSLLPNQDGALALVTVRY